MNRNKSLIVAGVVLAGLGGTVGTIYTNLRSKQEADPVVVRYEEAETQRAADFDSWHRIPDYEKMDYTPQIARTDYSVSAAHSEIEQATQRLESSEGAVNQIIEDEPVVRKYRFNTDMETLGYLGAFVGLAAVFTGIKRRIFS